MSEVEPSSGPEVAPCGLVCRPVCSHSQDGCVGCRTGGGPETCHTRECCQQHGLAGCWQCTSFPCAEGFFGDEAWSGLTVGCVQMVKEMGSAGFAELVVSRLGQRFDYGYLRCQTPEKTQAILRGQAEIPQEDPDLRNEG